MSCCGCELILLTDDKVVERVSFTQLCVDTALLLSLLWRCRRRGCHKEVHLIPRLSLLMNAEDNRQGMTQRDWSKAT